MAQELKVILSAEASSLFATLGQAQGRLQAFGNQGATSLGSISVGAQGAQNNIEGLTGSVFKAGAALEGIKVGFRQIVSLAQEAADATLAMERAQRQLQYATGDGGAAMAFVRRIAQDLGLDLQTAAAAYGQLSSAARGTRMEGQQTQVLFKSIASAATVMGLSAEETGGMVTALGQMMSKGKVSAEELRRQLGERLPGAFNIAARAMGVSTMQLDKMLETGQLLAEDFLPRFAEELQRTLGDAPAKAAQSAQANLNRLKTAWTDVLVAFGSGAMAEATEGAKSLAEALQRVVTDGTIREMGQDFGDLLGKARAVAEVAWGYKDAIVALTKGYITIKALGFVEHLRQQAVAKVQMVGATLAAKDATITEALALAGHTRNLQANTREQIIAAQMTLVYRSAALAGAQATGVMTIAEVAAERQAIALAAAKLAEAEAIAASSTAARAGGIALAGVGGPMGALILGVGAAVTAWSLFKRETKSAADEALAAAEKASQARSKYADLQGEAVRLSEAMKASKKGSEEYKQAQDQLQTVIKQMLEIHPELEKSLRKEGEAYVFSREQAKRDTEITIERTKALVKQTEAQIKATEALIAYRMAMADQAFATRMPGREGLLVAGGEARAQKSLADEARADAEKQKQVLAKSLEDLKALQADLERLSKPTGGGGGTKPDGKKPPENRWTEEMNQLRREGARLVAATTLEEQRQKDLTQIRLDLEKDQANLRERATKERWSEAQLAEALAQAEANAAQARINAENRFASERVRIGAELQGKLQVQEEAGLAKRQEAVRKHFDELRALNAKLAADDPAKLTSGQIDKAMGAALDRARVEQVRQDLSALRQELAQLAQVKGRALSLDEQREAMARFAQTSETAAQAVAQLTQEMHLNEGAQAGLAAGLRAYTVDAENTFENYKRTGIQAAQGVENAFAKGFEGMLTGQMTLSQGLKSIWKGITSTIVGALAQIMARWIVAKLAAKLFGDEQTKSAQKAAVAEQVRAAAGIFAAHSYIPFYGPVIAAALVTMMNAALVANAASAKGIVANAEGSLVTRPTLALIGEKGENEVVAPETKFKEWADNLTRNIIAQERQELAYQAQASGYASRAAGARAEGGAPAPIQVVLSNPQFVGQDRRSLEQFGSLALDAIQVAAKSRGVVLRPGGGV